MVQELRRIILNKTELILALEAHRRMTPNFLPDGKIVDLEPIDKSSVMVVVENDPSAQGRSITFNDGKLLNALLRFCLENNIMLPRAGEKSVLVAEDTVSLCINLDIEAYLGSNMEQYRSYMFAVAQ